MDASFCAQKNTHTRRLAHVSGAGAGGGDDLGPALQRLGATLCEVADAQDIMIFSLQSAFTEPLREFL
jgi:hypothetical protein